MSDLNPYEQLGVTENASFEEIQDARNRLSQQYHGDRQRVQEIEMAYDAVLMDRLRMRQEGKIKVPERIRFPEKAAPSPPANANRGESKPAPAWLQGWLDTPSQTDILLPAGIFLALSVLSLSYPSGALAIGAGISLYLLHRKEKRFGRAILLTFVGLIGGLVVGGLLATWMVPQMGIPVDPNAFAAWVAFFALWIVNSFLK
jgi:hypothetical protein